LHEFLRDNWERIPDFKEWSLYEENGDIVGYEYNTGEVGRIDLLARHKTDPRWLIIELKREQGTDETLDQVRDIWAG
jgi:RecB family endonuclease NucS